MNDYMHIVITFVLRFSFCAGFIGKIVLQIPFYRPHSDPWVISMSQLNLIIGPAHPQEYDEEREREAEREQKKQLLKALEDRWKVVKRERVMCIDKCEVHLFTCLQEENKLYNLSLSFRVKASRRVSHTGTQPLHLWSPG